MSIRRFNRDLVRRRLVVWNFVSAKTARPHGHTVIFVGQSSPELSIKPPALEQKVLVLGDRRSEASGRLDRFAAAQERIRGREARALDTTRERMKSELRNQQ
jgi:hypothetical protein